MIRVREDATHGHLTIVDDSGSELFAIHEGGVLQLTGCVDLTPEDACALADELRGWAHCQTRPELRERIMSAVRRGRP